MVATPERGLENDVPVFHTYIDIIRASIKRKVLNKDCTTITAENIFTFIFISHHQRLLLPSPETKAKAHPSEIAILYLCPLSPGSLDTRVSCARTGRPPLQAGGTECGPRGRIWSHGLECIRLARGADVEGEGMMISWQSDKRGGMAGRAGRRELGLSLSRMWRVGKGVSKRRGTRIELPLSQLDRRSSQTDHLFGFEYNDHRCLSKCDIKLRMH